MRSGMVALSLALAWACAPQIASSQPSEVQPGYESAGQPRTEFLLGDLRAFVGEPGHEYRETLASDRKSVV